MKKIIPLIAFLLMASSYSFATYSTDWIKPADSYLKTGSMIAHDKSDNVVVAGYIQAQNTYTRKYDKFGNFLWERISTSGISGNYEKPVWINCDKNKDIYVVGYRYTWGSSWEYPNAVVVLKYTSTGTLLWKKNIDLSYIVGSSTGMKFNLRSELDKNGNLYIGTAGTSPAGFVLMKLNPAGTVLVNTSVNLGTIHGFASMRLKNNLVIVTGTSEYVANLSIVAWDTAGTFLWSKYLTGYSGQDVEIDGNGNSYILTNYPNQVSANSGMDMIIYKFNAAGVQTWKKSYDFGGEETARSFTLVSTKLSVIGYGNLNASYFDWVTFQVNNSGNMLWNARYNQTTGNDEAPGALSATANGEVFVTGKGGPMFTQSNGSSYLRMITLKYSNSGAIQWIDSLNIYSGWGIASTLANDSSLFVLSGTNMTAFHFLDHNGTGTCSIPTNLKANNITDTTAKVSWAAVAGAYLYHLHYKTSSAADWTTITTDLTSIKIKALTAGTSYNYAIEAVCSSGPSGFSNTKNFTTKGTGYCSVGGLDASLEYLSLVWIGGIQNSTGNNNGYGDFTNLSTNLIQGSIVTGYLSAALPFGLTENYSIWIDYNHDNDFTDAGEQAVNISSDFLGWIGVNFNVPANATPGLTRMRVMMIFGVPPSPCGSYARGETEDYTVNIVPPKSGVTIEGISETGISNNVKVYPNPATNIINVLLNGFEGMVNLQVFDLSGKELYRQLSDEADQAQFDVHELLPGLYLVRATDEAGNISIIKWVKE
ncbi:MAG: GEVED domain-containing protein [Chitinophagales bacterium]